MKKTGKIPSNITALATWLWRVLKMCHSMSETLNPPERVIDNILTASARMSRVDEVLGKQRLQRFAQRISRILTHIEPSADGLCKVVKDKDTQVEIVIQLINAATELETAWNVIRLGNIPASQRQGRVASELVAVAVLMALPTSTLRSLPRKVPLARCLQDHPDKTVVDCYKPVIENRNEFQVAEPLLMATQFFASFLMVAETLLGIPKQTVEAIRDYRKQVQHPASHGTADLFSYHFEAFGGGAAGAVFDKKRVESYILAADELSNITHLLADILDWLTRYMVNSKESAG